MERSCTKPTASQPSNNPRHLYFSQFPVFLHDYIKDVVDVELDENYSFRAIVDVLGWGEKSWFLVRTQLDGEVYQHHQFYSKVFYDTVSEVRGSLRVGSLGV